MTITLHRFQLAMHIMQITPAPTIQQGRFSTKWFKAPDQRCGMESMHMWKTKR